MEEISTMQDYFNFMEQTLGQSFAARYPLLNEYYHDLKQACLKLNQCPRKDLFDSLKEILNLDAQLQILMDYNQWIKTNFYEISSEEDLIKQIKKDSHSFYRELAGLNISSKIPIGVIYLGDCIKE